MYKRQKKCCAFYELRNKHLNEIFHSTPTTTGNYQEADFSRVVTPEDCQRECAKRADCQSWTTNGPNTCMLKDTIPLHSFDYGIVSGIRTDWDVQDGMLTCKRPGFSPQSGDITLYPLQSGSEDQSFVVTDNVTELWKIFKKYGIKFHELKKSNYPKKNISLNHILVSV